MDASQLEKLSIAEQAANWIHIMQTAGPEERAAFWQWVKASPSHVRELLLAEKIDEQLGSIDRERRIDVKMLMAQAASNVTPIGERFMAAAAKQTEPRRTLSWTARIAASIAFVALAAGITYFTVDARGTYTTQLGEQRVFELEDGSVIYLNTQSQVKVRFSTQARDIYLREGQAMFKVQHDAARPFRVHAADTVIQAIGTQFDVRLFADRTAVSVVEGTVQVSTVEEFKTTIASANAPAMTPERITAGEGATIEAGGKIERPARIDTETVTAWRQQRLVFRGDTLGYIASEFNRYNVVPRLRVEGEALSSRRFNGVFSAHNPESLIKYLSQEGGLSFARDGDNVVIREMDGAAVVEHP